MPKQSLYIGKFIEVVEEDGWEFVQRHEVSEVVIVIPVMEDGSIVFISQHRKPIGDLVLEFPAGLVGDVRKDESELDAARTELLEETGLVASNLEYLTAGPTSAGLTNEMKEGAGGGNEHESIEVHKIPADNAEAFVAELDREGMSVDPKIFAGFYFLKQKGLL